MLKSIIDEGVPAGEAQIREYIDRTARNVVEYMIGENVTLSAAESCTGGMISSAITSVPGASRVFGCGIVSYSEKVKEEILGVKSETLKDPGVVSAETVLEMAEGVKRLSHSDAAIAVSGIAGPKSDSDPAPVGTVYAAVIYKDHKYAENLELYRFGNLSRTENRLLTVYFTLKLVLKTLMQA